MKYSIGDDGELNRDAPVNPEMDDPFADLGPDAFIDAKPKAPPPIPYMWKKDVPDRRVQFTMVMLALGLCGVLCLTCSALNSWLTIDRPLIPREGVYFVETFVSSLGGPCSVGGDLYLNGEKQGMFYVEAGRYYPFTSPGRARCLEAYGEE